jgi:hypothetical protein
LPSDTGSNPSAFEESAFQRQDKRIDSDVDGAQLNRVLYQIEGRGYGTPFHSPPSSPRTPLQTTIVALPGTILAQPTDGKSGGKYSKNIYKNAGKKEILGKNRVIYKMKGSNKEYVKSKGMYIPISEYKKLKK